MLRSQRRQLVLKLDAIQEEVLVWIRTYICVYVCMYVCVCVYVYACVRMRICIYLSAQTIAVHALNVDLGLDSK